jgi:hypothetical protein
VTGNESWFTLEFHHSTKWGGSRDDVAQKAKQQIETQKSMLTVIRGIDGFHVVDLMTEQHSYTISPFLSQIFEPLLFTVCPDGRKPSFRRLGLHLDNCHVCRSKASENSVAENSIIRMPHPPHSPGLVPSDFWLFGHMKVALVEQWFPGPKGLLTGIQEFLSEI